ncbi:MAG: Bacterial regulatory protein gntR family [Abditibacteriota bacterium]|nr:Bacterial regulatory protein gntR family [Abditibacteriota bacterium]
MTNQTKVQNYPKHRQLYDVIRGRIESDELRDGDKLPSEQDMAREFGVAYMTMRTVVNTLADWVRRQRGKCAFVAVPHAHPPAVGEDRAFAATAMERVWPVLFPGDRTGLLCRSNAVGLGAGRAGPL